jgi:hypothetical protein
MKSRVVLAVLAVMGILALTATAAQAGAGGMPFPIKSFFVCHGINADAPPPEMAKVDVVGSAALADPQNVRIGKGILACVIAKLFPAGSDHVIDQDGIPGPDNEIPPQPNTANQEGLKCYTMSSPRQPSTPGVPDSFTVTDVLSGEDANVQVNEIPFYLCAPANFLAPSQ